MVYTLNSSSLSAGDKRRMVASGCDRKVPEVWGQSLQSSDAHARKALVIPVDQNTEDV